MTLLNVWIYFLARTLWLTLPIVAAGVLQVFVLRYRIAESWAWPIDCGMTVRGRRLFGDHKTFRGFVVMIVGSAVMFGIQVGLAHLSEPVQRLGWVDYRATAWWLAGGIYGAGYVLGELPNSFLKRQLDIGPGRKGTGAIGVAFLVYDQIDGILGVLLTMRAFYTPSWHTAVSVLLLLALIHVVVFNVLLLQLGMKQRLF